MPKNQRSDFSSERTLRAPQRKGESLATGSLIDELITLSAALAEYRGRLYVGGAFAEPEPVSEDLDQQIGIVFAKATGAAFGLENIVKASPRDRFNAALADLSLDDYDGSARVSAAACAMAVSYFRSIELPASVVIYREAMQRMVDQLVRALIAAGILAMATETPVLVDRPRTRRYCELVVRRYARLRREVDDAPVCTTPVGQAAQALAGAVGDIAGGGQ